MNNILLEVSSNWSQIGGSLFSQCVQVEAADSDLLKKPYLDELVDEQKSILLNKEHSLEHCELCIKILPQYKIQDVFFVCTVPKVEIFHGHIKEYIATVYGIIADESDNQFKTYRYDVEVEKSGVTELTFRFLTDFSDVCIFGIMLFTAPNPNGITTLLPNRSGKNIQNVQSFLRKSSKQLAQTSVKPNELLEHLAKTNQSKILMSDQLTKQEMDGDHEEKAASTIELNGETFLNQLKLHINDRFQEMELRINRRLECIEQRQMQNLDKILASLEKINK